MPEAPEAPAIEPDQPTMPEAPEGDQSSGEQDSFTESYDPNSVPEEARPQLEAAYKQLQADYTRKRMEEAGTVQEAQELREFAEAMQDPATRDAILEQQFGYEFDDGGQEEQFLDPEEELAARVDQLEGHLTQRQQEQFASEQESELTEYVAEEIEGLEKAQGKDFEFSPEELAFISTYAHTHPGPNGIPDVKGANEALNKILDQRQKSWIDSKKSPRRISQGVPGSKTVEPKDRGERMELALEAMENAEA